MLQHLPEHFPGHSHFSRVWTTTELAGQLTVCHAFSLSNIVSRRKRDKNVDQVLDTPIPGIKTSSVWAPVRWITRR